MSYLIANTVKGHAYENGDFQIWHTENQEVNINKETKLTLEEEFRFGDDAHDFYYQHYDAGVVGNVNKNLSLGVNYRQIYEKKKNKFKEENRLLLNATVKCSTSGFDLEDRNRFQYRHFDYQKDFWQYRNKLTAKLPWKFTKLHIRPYVADEVFIDLDKIEFTRNRFSSGIGLDLTKNIKAELYYLLQNTKTSDRWPSANVFGSKLKIQF
jgi:hypothetical protein